MKKLTQVPLWPLLNTMSVGQHYRNRVTMSCLFIKDLNESPTKEYCFYT